LFVVARSLVCCCIKDRARFEKEKVIHKIRKVFDVLLLLLLLLSLSLSLLLKK